MKFAKISTKIVRVPTCERSNNDNNENNIQFKPYLKHFNYFNDNNTKDGTLLHASVYFNYINYSQILIDNKFDMNKYNPFVKTIIEDKHTPFDIAKDVTKNTFLIGLMQV